MKRLSLALGLMALSLSQAVWAQTNYAQKTVGIRVGVVVLQNTTVGPAPGVSANSTPFVWNNLEQNRSVKPANWTFYNPRSASVVTPAILARWTTIKNVVGGPAPTLGQKLTKRHAPYWEVSITGLSEPPLSEYDVLYIAAHGFIQLTNLERERLRTFVDQGGVLWIDTTNDTTVSSQAQYIENFPLPINRRDGAKSNLSVDFFHPLMSYPNGVSLTDLYDIDWDSYRGLLPSAWVPFDFTVAGHVNLRTVLSNVEPESNSFSIVASDTRGAYLQVGQIGNGFIVATARGVGITANRAVDASGNTLRNNQYFGLTPATDRAADAASRLIVNLISLTSGHRAPSSGSRAMNSSPIDAGAPALRRFTANLGLSPGNNNYVPPAIYKGLVVVPAYDRIYVYDAKPRADLDSNGDPDDGIRDLALGQDYDLLWVSRQMTGPISAPMCFETTRAGAGPHDQIAVVDGNGRLCAFDAFQMSGGVIQGLTNAPYAYGPLTPPGGTSPVNTGVSGRGPYAPTFYNGYLYIADSQDNGLGQRNGRIWVADPSAGVVLNTGSQGWGVGGGSSPGIGDISARPTIGYIPIADNSGGSDLVAYVPTRPVPSGGPGTTASVYSLWLGARGEKPLDYTVSGNTLIVRTRASQQGMSVFVANGAHPLGIKLTLLRSNGTPLTGGELNLYFTGNVSQTAGIIRFELKSGFPNFVTGVRIDYRIDLGTGSAGLTQQIVRGALNFPDDSDRNRRVIGPIALTPEGNIFASVSNQSNQGGLYGFKEDGRGTFKMIMRYELFGAHRIVLNQATPVSVSALVGDTDPLKTLLPQFFGQPIENLTIQGPPTVSNGVVYITVTGAKRFTGGPPFPVIPTTVLMAFRSNPPTPTIVSGDMGSGFTLVQKDWARSSRSSKSGATATPDVESVLQPNQYVYEKLPGADKGTIRIDNLMGTNRGPIANSISLSQPLIIRRGTQPDIMIEPDTLGGNWSPLLWYTVFNGSGSTSAPDVTGGTVYLAGTSALPGFLNGVTFTIPPVTNGMLFALDSNISPSDSFLGSDTARPWMKQLYSFSISGSGGNPNIRANADFRWPQLVGLQSFDDWRVRVLQTVLSTSNQAYGIVAGDGAVVSWGNGGVYGFGRSDFFVADDNRIARFDPSGNPIWSLEQTLFAGGLGSGATSNMRKIVRPTRAYSLSQNETLVVDTGSDRIIRIDNNGRELRSIDSIVIDPQYQPDGYRADMPLKLVQPRDALLYTTYEANPTGVSNPQPLEYWVHYFIADSGNKRLVEVVDRYAVNVQTRQIGVPITMTDGRRALGILKWITPANYSGKQYLYTSVSRIFVEDTNNPGTGQWVFAAGIGSQLPTRADSGLDAPTPNNARESDSGNGGVILFNGAGSVVINEMIVPAIPAGVYWDFATGTWSAASRTAATKKFAGVRSVAMRNAYIGGVSKLTLMVTDQTGVYEIYQPTGGTDWVVRWMIDRTSYRVMRRNNTSASDPGTPNGENVDFSPMYARRLDSGDILLVNGYVGRKVNGSQYYGEVIQLDGQFDLRTPGASLLDNSVMGFSFNKANLGFRSVSVTFELPPVQGARSIVGPVFGDRR